MSDPIEFVTRPKGSKKWSKQRRRPDTAQRVRDFIEHHSTVGNDCRIGKSATEDSHPTQWSGKITSSTANRRIVAWLESAEGADVLHVEAAGEELQVRAILTKSYRPGVDVDPNISAFWSFIQRRAPKAVSWGIFSCRAIAGTDTYSGHAWLKAIDIHGPRLVMALVARLAVHKAKAFKLVVVIYNGRIWTPTAGWHTYTGQCPHQQHVHVNVEYPSSVPPCA